jgi:hypothetical protein
MTKQSKGFTPRNVSPARLAQKSGTSFGGYAKVAKPGGGFTMKATGGKK